MKAHTVAQDIERASRGLRGRDLASLRRQLERAASSIPANIVEGSSAATNPEFARFLGIALSSAAETHYHLLTAMERGALPPIIHRALSDRVEEVRRMLTGLIKRVRATD